MKLYELSEAMLELGNMDDMDPDTIDDTMAGIEADFVEKAQGAIMVSRDREGEASVLEAEAKRMLALAKAKRNQGQSLLNYVKREMAKNERTKTLNCPLFTVTLAKGVPIAVIDNEDEVPDDYIEIKTSMAVKKKDLLKALQTLEEGESIPGAHLSRSEPSLRIK